MTSFDLFSVCNHHLESRRTDWIICSVCLSLFATAVEYLLHFRRGKPFRFVKSPSISNSSFSGVGEWPMNLQSMLNDSLTQNSIEWRMEMDELNESGADKRGRLSRSCSFEQASMDLSMDHTQRSNSMDHTQRNHSMDHTQRNHSMDHTQRNHSMDHTLYNRRMDQTLRSYSLTQLPKPNNKNTQPSYPKNTTNPQRPTGQGPSERPRPTQPNRVSSHSSSQSSAAYDTGLGPFLTSLKLSKKKFIGSSDYQSLVCYLKLRYVCTSFRIRVPYIE